MNGLGLKGRAKPKEAHVHYYVAEVARELCLASYEELMANNQIRTAWKLKHPGASELGLQAAWLKRYAIAYVGPARATLAALLTGPCDEGLKEKIHQALILDNTLMMGRNAPKAPIAPKAP